MPELESSAVSEPALEKKADRFYHPELDGLRFFAFLMVFMHHALPIAILADSPFVMRLVFSLIRAGEQGVDLFFALSAYLITELLLRERERTGQIHLWAFYVRRSLRIWPLYFVFVIFAATLEPWIIPGWHLVWPYTLGYLTFMGNWMIVLRDALPASSALILWTVSIEEQYYIVWPLILRNLSLERLPRIAGILWLGGILMRVFLVAQGASMTSINFNTISRLDPIAVGILIAWRFHHGVPVRSTQVRWGLILAGFAGVILTTFVTHTGPSSVVMPVTCYALWATSVGMILHGAFTASRSSQRVVELETAGLPGAHFLRAVRFFTIWEFWWRRKLSGRNQASPGNGALWGWA